MLIAVGIEMLVYISTYSSMIPILSEALTWQFP